VDLTTTAEGVEKQIKEYTSKEAHLSLFKNPKVLEVLNTMTRNKFTSVIDIVDTHITIFYPLSYFRTETLNKVLADSEKHNDLSFHWI
jgi:hypothetical protein